MNNNIVLSERLIITFIKQFSGAEYVFLNGMCYWFAFILQSRFMCGEIIYDPIIGHFLWVCRGVAYDIEGSHVLPDIYEPILEIEMNDPKRYWRIVRECILKTE